MTTISAELIGNNISKYRTMAGLTQAQLAERIGVSIPFISRVERGQKLMKLQTLCAIAQALNVSCDALLRECSSSVYIENINAILAEQPAEFLVGIERMIRACVEEFAPKANIPSTVGTQGPPLGGVLIDSQRE